MRSGSDQRPRGRYNGNRPFGQQRGSPRSQTFDSNAPNTSDRGTAHQIFERYVALAREASIGDDPVAAENLYQHAEHYFRVANANRDASAPGPRPQPAITADDGDGASGDSSDRDPELPQPDWSDVRSGFV
jgi:hypothetical protein